MDTKYGKTKYRLAGHAAAAFSALLLGEPIRFMGVCGAVLIVAGVAAAGE